MALEMLLERFDGLLQTPADVEKLEQQILQWAVEGRLVEQDPEDESIDALRSSLASQVKAHLASRKLRKKWLQVGQIDSPYQIPDTWEWVLLADLCIVERGISFPASAKEFEPTDENIACLRTANVQDAVDWDDILYVSRSYMNSPDKLIREHDILISMANSYELVGKVSYVDRVPFKATLGGFISAIRANSGVDPRFLVILLRSGYTQTAFRASSSQTTNIANISLSGIYPLPMPLPPAAEQKRIVARVDALFEETRALKAQLAEAQRVRDRLQQSALVYLTADSTDTSRQTAWSILASQFDALHTTADHVDALKQTILQLAVMGKLVPQNPDDEPAAVLLERIAAEKARLVKAGEIPKSKKLPPISERERPFEIPSNWEWVRAEAVSKYVIDCLHSTPKFVDYGELYCVDTTNINQGQILFDKLRRVSERTFNERIRRLKPQTGDVLFSREGTIGQSIIVPPNIEICLGQRMMQYRVFESIVPAYFRFTIVSPMFVEQWSSNIKGTAAHHVNMKALRAMLVPIPPTAEQKRIVTRVDELFALADRLAAQLRSSEATREHLLDAVLAQA